VEDLTLFLGHDLDLLLVNAGEADASVLDVASIEGAAARSP